MYDFEQRCKLSWDSDIARKARSFNISSIDNDPVQTSNTRPLSLLRVCFLHRSARLGPLWGSLGSLRPLNYPTGGPSQQSFMLNDFWRRINININATRVQIFYREDNHKLLTYIIIQTSRIQQHPKTISRYNSNRLPSQLYLIST